jgi:hypothetical protein
MKNWTTEQVEQRNRIQRGDAVFHQVAWYLKRMLMVALAPWMVWIVLMWFSVVDYWAVGSPDHNGGMTGLFQDMGLHPHATYKVVLWTTVAGALLAVAWLLLRVAGMLVDVAGRKIKKTGWVVNLMQKTASLRDILARAPNDHPHKTNALALGLLLAGIAVSTILLAPHPNSSPKHQGTVLPPLANFVGIQQSVRYAHVLLKIPTGKPPHVRRLQGPPRPWIPEAHTIYGKAVVTQTGPQTYQVRMVP